MVQTASDLMHADVRTVRPGMSLPDLDREFVQYKLTGFPVVEGGRVVGIVSRSDVVRQLSVEQSVGEIVSDYYREFDGAAPVESLESVARRVGRRYEQLTVRDVMITDVISVEPDAPLVEVARVLVSRRIHRVPVLEVDGRLLGIVSALDFVRLFAEVRVAPA